MGFLSDVGNAISSGASTVGDVVEDTVDAITDTVEDAVDTVVDTVRDGIGSGTDWLCKNKPGGLIVGELACGFGNITGGIFDGLLKGVNDLLHDGFDIIRDIGGIVGSILRLDLPGLLKDLGILIIDVLDSLVDLGRFFIGGYIVGGIVGKFKRSSLIRFVENLVDLKFDDNPDIRTTVRRNIGLDGGKFGFRLSSEHRVFVMDSDDVPLWQMHNAGTIDLYAMAGLLSFDSFSIGQPHPNTVVKSVSDDGSDSFWPVSRWTISKHLESQGQEKRLRVYSMSKRIAAQTKSTATRKWDEVGVILEWNNSDKFSWFGENNQQEITQNEYDYNNSFLESLLSQPEYNRPSGEYCSLLALAGFKFSGLNSSKNGKSVGQDIDDCIGNSNFDQADCDTPGRNDDCCVIVNLGESSGVIYADQYPSDVFQYVLAHEIGHYLGLCHCGHNGFQHIMFRPDLLDLVSWGSLSYYWESEPHLSLEDGKNSWRFIIDQLTPCLTGIAPEIISTPVTDSRLGSAYEYQAGASGTRPILWSLLSGPTGLMINPGTGLVTWTPDTIGEFEVEIQVTNTTGKDTQSYTINVTRIPIIE